MALNTELCVCQKYSFTPIESNTSFDLPGQNLWSGFTNQATPIHTFFEDMPEPPAIVKLKNFTLAQTLQHPNIGAEFYYFFLKYKVFIIFTTGLPKGFVVILLCPMKIS